MPRKRRRLRKVCNGPEQELLFDPPQGELFKEEEREVKDKVRRFLARLKQAAAGARERLKAKT